MFRSSTIRCLLHKQPSSRQSESNPNRYAAQNLLTVPTKSGLPKQELGVVGDYDKLHQTPQEEKLP